MIPHDQQAESSLRNLRLMAVLMLVVAPIVWFVVTRFVDVVPKESGEVDLMFAILGIVAIVKPAVAILLERVQIGNFRKPNNSKMQPHQFAFTIWLSKLAITEAVYIFALVYYFLSGDLNRYLLFYIPAIFWTLVYWPRESGFRTLLERLEVK